MGQGLGEVLPVDGVPVLHKAAVVRVGGGHPGRAGAFPAVDNGQDRFPEVVGKVVGVQQARVGCPEPGRCVDIVRQPIAVGVGGDVGVCRDRIRWQRHHHAFQFPNPEVDADGEEGMQLVGALFETSGEGQQGHETLKQVPYFGLGPRTKLRERSLKMGRDLVDRTDGSVQGPEQGGQEFVCAQPAAQLGAPGTTDVLRCFAPKPDLIQAAYQPDGILHACVAGKVRHPCLAREVVGRFKSPIGCEVLGEVLAVFRDHRVRIELLVEQVLGVVDDGFGVVLASQSCGGADAAQGFLGHGQAVLQSADEAGEIGTLCAVEGVEFVHHQKPQRLGPVVFPEALAFRADQEAVQHSVVGQQDVRRGFMHGPAGPNDVVLQHGGGRVRRFRVRVHAGRDPAPQFRGVPDAGCNAPGLILRQGIHGVDDDGLDARLVRVSATPVEDGQLEAFGLARTCAGGDDRGPRGVGLQSPEGFQLVGVGGVAERDRGEGLRIGVCAGVGQVQAQVRSPEEIVRLLDEVVDEV